MAYTLLEYPPNLQQLEELTGCDSKAVRIINCVASKWEELAIALDFDAPAIDCIRRDFSSDCKEACSQMLQKWIKMEYSVCKPVTWTVLIQCLQDAEFSTLAKDLSEILTPTSC